MKNQTGNPIADFFFHSLDGVATLGALSAATLIVLWPYIKRLLRIERLPDIRPVPLEIQDRTRTPSPEVSRRNSDTDPESVPLIPMIQMQMMNSTPTQTSELPRDPNRAVKPKFRTDR